MNGELPVDSTPIHLVVIGLGYVGLPLALEATRSALSCTGLDVSDRTVSGLNSGRSHVDDISDSDVRAMLESGFQATRDPSCLASADVIVICVPTPLDENQAPDLTAVHAATTEIAQRIAPGTLVILESTTYPGTTDGPVRERLEQSGLRAGIDFNLAFSPERIDPGNPHFNLRNTPKVVGGFTPACTERAVGFYRHFVDELVPTAGLREAELAKLLENTYRHVNIALVNEMAIFCQELDIDIWASIDAASSKPFGFQAFYPGPGVGGHCIPIDPNYLSYQVRSLGYPFRFVELAQEISGRMPVYVVARVQQVLNDRSKAVRGAKVLLLGLTYKADIADDRETPSRSVIRKLRELGAIIECHDPFVERFTVDDEPVYLVDDLYSAIDRSDVVVLLQAHSSFDLQRVADRAAVVFDTRGVMTGDSVVRL
jgi:UDP-N-acetyl-D-glucosamine dehydrogenase